MYSDVLCVPLQASGYGSGDDTYEDMEGRDEVKKVVEEREYTLVCTHMHTLTHTHPHAPSIRSAGLDLDQRKQRLSFQAWRRLEHSVMCCLLLAVLKTRAHQGSRAALVSYFIDELDPHF